MRNKNRTIGRNKDMSEKRQQAKFERKFGQKYLQSLGYTEREWCSEKDPLYKIRGSKRYFLARP